MYEKKHEALLPLRHFLQRLSAHLFIAIALIAVTVLIGTLGHLLLEAVSWHDALLNTALIVSGLGPFILPKTIAGKVFLSLYGIMVGLIFMASLGVILAPLAHRLLHKFHLESKDD